VLQEQGLALVRGGGGFVGVQPSAEPDTKRGIRVVAVAPRRPAVGDLLARTVSGDLSARVHAVVPFAGSPKYIGS
jgi:hypothetical protein